MGPEGSGEAKKKEKEERVHKLVKTKMNKKRIEKKGKDKPSPMEIRRVNRKAEAGRRIK